MIEVGAIKELWRYPVKSMDGNRTRECLITKQGMVGDRNWALRDEDAGELTSVRKIPKLLKFKARYNEEPGPGKVSSVTIELPDGSSVESTDEHVDRKLSEALGKPVSLWPLQPRSNLRHYRLAVPAGATAMKKQFATKELPDFSSVSWRFMMELALFATPLGRYHDVYPLHLVTTGSLERLRQLEPEGDFRVERFRPNLLVETDPDSVDFNEFHWVDGQLHIGDVVLKVVSRTVRCSMPAQPQVAIKKDAKVIRTLDAHTERHLGVNISVVKAGAIRVGDPVRLQPANRSALSRRIDAVSSRLRNAAIQRSFDLIDRFTGKR